MRQKHFSTAPAWSANVKLKITINDGDYRGGADPERSDFQCAAILFYEKQLTQQEILDVGGGRAGLHEAAPRRRRASARGLMRAAAARL